MARLEMVHLLYTHITYTSKFLNMSVSGGGPTGEPRLRCAAFCSSASPRSGPMPPLLTQSFAPLHAWVSSRVMIGLSCVNGLAISYAGLRVQQLVAHGDGEGSAGSASVSEPSVASVSKN